MRKIVIVLVGALLLTACGKNQEQTAKQLAAEARTLLENGDPEGARVATDSLRRTFPDIVEARKSVIRLHQDIELKRAQKELALTDSTLQIANRELDSLQEKVEMHKTALQATPEELTALTRMKMRRDSIRTQFETIGAKIRYIHQKQKESGKVEKEE